MSPIWLPIWSVNHKSIIFSVRWSDSENIVFESKEKKGLGENGFHFFSNIKYYFFPLI